MADLADLYQQIILDHNKSPRNFGSLDSPSGQAEGNNPLCGDRVTVHVRLDGSTIADVRFSGSGCAISRASASLMTAAVKGKDVREASALADRFHGMVTSDPNAPVSDTGLGKLAALAGVRAFPARVKCATLPWHTLRAALSGSGETISTE